MNSILFITGNNGFFGQTRKPWVSMDSELIAQRLRENGFDVEMKKHHEIANSCVEIKDRIVFYSFSQLPNIRNQIRDIVQYLDNGTNLIVPSYELLLCHENKGYQELYKKKQNIRGLKAWYFTCYEDIKDYEFDFPLVFKPVSGSNAKGIRLVHSKDELKEHLLKLQSKPLRVKFDLFRRKYLRKSKTYKEYPNYSNESDLEQYKHYIIREQAFVLQEFVPDLKSDFRILVINDKYYVTKRHVNDGDFRASGTKKFDFDFEIDKEMLNYAKKMYETFDTPFLSMDICYYGDSFSLFEFQALHFGLNVYVKNDTAFVHNGKDWQKVEYTNQIEIDIADGLFTYIKNR